MEILKRAKGKADGEIVSFSESESNLKEEIDKRTYKAGYTNPDGTPKIHIGCGKGDRYRPCNKRKFDENYVKIFGHD